MMNTIDMVDQPTTATTTVLAPTPAPAPASTFGVVKKPPRGPKVLVSSWQWRALFYIVSFIPIGIAWGAFAIGWLSAGVGGFFLLGFVLLALLPLLAIPLGAIERWRLLLMGYPPVPSPHRALPPGDATFQRAWEWVKLRWTEPATWRELAFGVLFAIIALVDAVVGFVAVVLLGGYLFAPLLRFLVNEPIKMDSWWVGGIHDPLIEIEQSPLHLNIGWIDLMQTSWANVWIMSAVALVLIVLSLWLTTYYARGRAALTYWLLAPPPEVAALTESRARIVNSFDFERQRIERDIHDGPQQQLTALLMTLGVAKKEAADAPESVRTLIDEAQDQAQTALTDLRNLVQGIHPSLLTDRGLVAAVEAMTRQLPIDVTLTAEVNQPVPQHIEVAAYFVISEALTNVAKHSGSASASVLIRTDGGRLIVAVTDNGVGGAQHGKGSGLVGIDDRIQAVGGTMTLTSPAGGPTVLRVELPCG